MSETALTPANQNPWYVLMTLYGEQTGSEVDWDLHEKNLAAWNAWACQGMCHQNREKFTESSELNAVHPPVLNSERNEDMERQHRKEMLRRNVKNFEYPGMPVAGHVVDLSSVAFERHLVLRQAVFSGDVSFAHSEFGGVAQFRLATFMRTAWFASTKFHQAACFGKATFGNEVGFGNAIFVKEAGFGHAIFNGIAAFGEATFKGDADFGGAKFRQTAEFGATIYAKNAVFRSTVFSEEVDFGGAEFVGSVWFNGAAFNGFAYFQVATFDSTGKNQLANFIDCQLEKPTNFRDAVFNASYPDFAGTVLHERTSFTDHSENWPKASRNPARAKDSCAVIRHNLGKQGLPEAEHFFYRREMGFAGQSGPLWQRPPYWLFGWFSDYGYSILTPFLWLLLLIVLGAYVLAWGLAGGAQAVSFEQGLGLSFSNVFNFLGFHRTFVEADFTLKLPQWLKVVSAFQTIAGVVLLFFLGLGLRTRFRLR